MSWAENEFRNFDLGDKRIKKRAVKFLETLATSPKASIPQACQGWAETKWLIGFIVMDWGQTIKSTYGSS